MAETTMPAAEVAVAEAEERNSYELAFHVLPTVAEGEVSGVFDAIKALVTKTGGEVFDEESPEHFELAYEIVKHIEGKNRTFSSSYFGWVRFKAEGEQIIKLAEEVDSHPQILRYLLLKLTKVEEENPFRFHEALAAQEMVTSVEDSEVVPDLTTVDHSTDAAKDEEKKDDTSKADSGEVDEQAIDKALEEKEV